MKRLPSDGNSFSDRKGRATTLFVLLLVVSVAHFVVSVETHREHIIHIFFSGLYLIGIIAAALWFGFAGAAAASVGVSLSYLGHIVISWRGQPMENANQYATIGVFLLIGVVSGALVESQKTERRRRLQSERHAQREAVVKAIAGLSNALGFRDGYTEEHCQRVAAIAVAIGRRRRLSFEELERLRLAALIHDVGKIGVPDDILLKPDRLSAAERTKIERHPVIAAEILGPIHGAEDIAEIVLCHHECPDGTGYPRGMTAAHIPLEAHILRVAEVFSALTDARPYKADHDAKSVLSWMRERQGTQLDRESVRVLADLVAEGDLEASRGVGEGGAA